MVLILALPEIEKGAVVEAWRNRRLNRSVSCNHFNCLDLVLQMRSTASRSLVEMYPTR